MYIENKFDVLCELGSGSFGVKINFFTISENIKSQKIRLFTKPSKRRI